MTTCDRIRHPIEGTKMQAETHTSKAQAAETKIRTGTLMNIEEVAAKLDVSLSTVHRLALPSIRIGRLLRYDPSDVLHLIQSSKEPTAA
jgi:predicted DNA-binding transcriptional regulator AlpA